MLFSHKVTSESLWPHGLQHIRLPSPLSQSLLKLTSVEAVMSSNHLIICHSLPSCLQSFPTSGSFPVSQLFTSSVQSIGASASASVQDPVNIQGWFPLGLTGLISLLSKESLLQHHSSEASVLWQPAFFMVQLPHPYRTTGKTIPLAIWTFVGKVMSLLFNMLSRFVIAFLPRSKHLLIGCSHCLQWVWRPRK